MASHEKNTNIKVKEKEREREKREYSIKNAPFPGVVRTKAFQAFPKAFAQVSLGKANF